jgi:DnaJ family protein B protein 12
VYTFGGNQFNAGRRARTAAGGTEPQSPFLALLPVALLIFFVLFSLIPTIFSGDHVPDPEFRFKPSTYFDTPRTTWQRNVPYHVNTAEWDKSQVWQSVPENYRQRLDAAMFSSKLRRFERGIEEVHIRQLQAEVSSERER